MADATTETSPALVRALLYGGPAFYFVVTVGVGFWVFLADRLLLGVTLGVAVVGAVVGFLVLRRSYRSAGYR